MSTIGSMETLPAEPLAWTSISPGSRNPGRMPGTNTASPRQAKAIRLAPRSVVAGPSRRRRPRHIVSGPQWPTRRRLSANSTAIAAARNAAT